MRSPSPQRPAFGGQATAIDGPLWLWTVLAGLHGPAWRGRQAYSRDRRKRKLRVLPADVSFTRLRKQHLRLGPVSFLFRANIGSGGERMRRSRRRRRRRRRIGQRESPPVADGAVTPAAAAVSIGRPAGPDFGQEATTLTFQPTLGHARGDLPATARDSDSAKCCGDSDSATSARDSDSPLC